MPEPQDKGGENQPEERVLFDKEGNEVKVPTDDQIKGWRKGHDANKSRKELLGKLNLGDDPVATVTQLRESEHPNWKKMRAANASMKKALEDKGIKVKDDGSIEESQQAMTPEQVQEITNQGIIADHKNSRLDNIQDKDLRGKVDHFFNKLTAGEKLDSKTKVDMFIDQAIKLAVPDASQIDPIKTAVYGKGGGKAPASAANDNFANTEQGQALGKKLGLSSFQDKK